MATVSRGGKKRIVSVDGKVVIPISSSSADTKITMPIAGSEDRFKLTNQEMKLSQPGVDVNTSTAQESIVNSVNNVFKIVETGTITIPSVTLTSSQSSGNSTYTLNHSYGEAVTCIAYFTDDYGGVSPLPGFRVFDGFSTIFNGGSAWERILPLNEYVIFKTYTDRVEFVNYFTNSFQPLGDPYTADEVPIKYYLMLETAT